MCVVDTSVGMFVPGTTQMLGPWREPQASFMGS